MSFQVMPGCAPDCGITRGRVGVAHTGDCVPAFQVIEQLQKRVEEKEQQIVKLKLRIFDLQENEW